MWPSKSFYHSCCLLTPAEGVVDGVAEDHGAEGAIDAVVHPKRLDPQHHRVQLVSHLLPQLVCLCLVFDNIEDCAFEILNFAIFR